MAQSIYILLVVGLGTWGLISGFRRGISGQICSLLGMAFGIVCARALMFEAQDVARSFFPVFKGHTGADFIYSTIAAGSIYTIVYVLFVTLTKVLHGALKRLPVGILNSMGGSVVGALKYLIVLSIFFNCIVCLHPASVLVKSSSDSDGNILGGVMDIAPGMLGSLSCTDFALSLQLEEAGKISDNGAKAMTPSTCPKPIAIEICLLYKCAVDEPMPDTRFG